MLSSISYLYILEFKPLSEVSLANMFLHTVSSRLILLTFFFSGAEAFQLDVVPFIDFSFISLSLGGKLA